VIDPVVASEGVDHHSMLRLLPRVCRWTVLAGGVTLTWALTWWRVGDITSEPTAVWLLRVVIVLGSLTAAFALDDPSRNVTESTVLARRQLVPARLAVASAVVVLAALPAALSTTHLLSRPVAWGLALEAVTVFGLLAAAALTLQRRGQLTEPAQYLVLVVPLLAMADPLTAGRWPLLVGPGPAWASAHGRWAVVATVAIAVCVWQLRDPASRSPLRRIGSFSGRRTEVAAPAARRTPRDVSSGTGRTP
jgi:hypothetical protein